MVTKNYILPVMAISMIFMSINVFSKDEISSSIKNDWKALLDKDLTHWEKFMGIHLILQ